jgi:hypothetical protein
MQNSDMQNQEKQDVVAADTEICCRLRQVRTHHWMDLGTLNKVRALIIQSAPHLANHPSADHDKKLR